MMVQIYVLYHISGIGTDLRAQQGALVGEECGAIRYRARRFGVADSDRP